MRFWVCCFCFFAERCARENVAGPNFPVLLRDEGDGEAEGDDNGDEAGRGGEEGAESVEFSCECN